MKTIIVYQTDDGCRFDKFEAAIKYEKLCKKCDEINNKFINIGRDLNYNEYINIGRDLNYNEYIQQDIHKVNDLFKEFMNIVSEAIPSCSKIAQECSKGIRHKSHIYRIISDYNIKCLNTLMFRFECISFENGKEFQQPYFVTHQEEATIKAN